MSENALIWAVVIGMGVVNYALRFLPLAALSRMKLPRAAMRWLSYIPISVMGALMAKEVLLAGKPGVAAWMQPGYYGAAAAMLVYWRSKSFIGSTLAGVALFLVLRWVLGLG